ncbi:ammonium transporter [Sphingomonas paeninsulae]|jgi:Amt family ammonium transporter|uniref:Ammonium transporter n=1 Tax=Sphingomonas paeninsulae TaxID=2319844 RepID=A0A494TP66_SPHPE|nr:ammonium transporter [Sphingomonas paeninsulae]AYJ87268.1 ammonium transporter [Sphingomonas paeninsulae]
MKSIYRPALTALSVFGATAAQGQPIIVADSGDSAWVLAASAIALFAALPGLALFHGRDRESDHGTAMFVSVAIASLMFAIIGYSLAFGEGSSIIGGSGNAMLGNMAELRADATISDTVYALFELSIAVFAVGIMVSSIANRARIGWLTGFIAIWSLIVYAPIAHWIWGGGWLAELGVLDFGGGMVVQVAAGTATLVIALLLGPGQGNVAGDGRLTLAGLWLVWIGWSGVIGGAALSGGNDAATAMLNAQFAASAALLTGFAIARWRRNTSGDYSFGTAAIAGLAAISTGAAFVGPGGAIALGVLGAIAAWAGSIFITRLNVGSTASAFVSSGCGGIVGAIAFPVFVSPTFGGPGFDEGVGLLTQTLAQGVGVLVVILWSAVVTAIAALMVSMIAPMRVRV